MLLETNAGQQFVVEGPLVLDETLTVPPDKSITHRALILSFLAGGSSRIVNPCLAQDCQQTLCALTSLGYSCQLDNEALLTKPGSNWRKQPQDLYAGNSGTTARLLMGLAGHLESAAWTITGDESLSQRPMERVARYLRDMGADIAYHGKPGLLPLSVWGPVQNCRRHELEVASAQVKSAILLAGLAMPGTTSVVQRIQTRNHTELMLAACGARIAVSGPEISIEGRRALAFPPVYKVPGDFSASAPWLALAAISGAVCVQGVGLNPSRTGFLDVLQTMGAKVSIQNTHIEYGEPRGDIYLQHGELRGIELGPRDIPGCVDELPLLAVVAATARGRTVVRGAGELRIKESDRLQATVDMLQRFGASCRLLPDGFVIQGGAKLEGTDVCYTDHRMIMAAAVLAAGADGCSHIGDSTWLGVSYPGFAHQLATIFPGQICLETVCQV